MPTMSIVDIKEKIQAVLQAANTTTASVDLSRGMTNRVNQVLKVNPLRIYPQASSFPCVTIYTDRKDLAEQTIMGTQQGNRRADLKLKILGMAWNSNVASHDEDPADEDCERLMENIEEIVRNNFTLDGTVNWTFPDAVAYHQARMDEQTHLRAGEMDLKVRMYY